MEGRSHGRESRIASAPPFRKKAWTIALARHPDHLPAGTTATLHWGHGRANTCSHASQDRLLGTGRDSRTPPCDNRSASVPGRVDPVGIRSGVHRFGDGAQRFLDDLGNSVRLGDHRDVRGVELGDPRLRVLGHLPLLGQGNDPILGADQSPRRDDRSPIIAPCARTSDHFDIRRSRGGATGSRSSRRRRACRGFCPCRMRSG